METVVCMFAVTLQYIPLLLKLNTLHIDDGNMFFEALTLAGSPCLFVRVSTMPESGCSQTLLASYTAGAYARGE